MERDGVWRREGVRSNGNGNAIHIESLITALAAPDGDSIGLLVVMRDITSVKQKEHDQQQRLEALRHASDRFRVLEGLIPICSHCKQIRDQVGSWHEPDAYLRDRFHVKFTHGICPVCAEKHHPGCLHKSRQRQGPGHAQGNHDWYDAQGDLRTTCRRIEQSQVNEPFAHESVQRRQCRNHLHRLATLALCSLAP